MSITRGQFLRSLTRSLPGLVASTGVATAAEAIFRRVAQVAPSDAKVSELKAAADFVPFLERGPADLRVVALTFDDGPEPGITERLLETLRAHDARATFFMIGEKVAAAPELARRVRAEGHEIGDHTFTHPKLTEQPMSRLDEEIDRSSAVFAATFGSRPIWFRPPFGALRPDQARHVQARGMTVTTWSVDAADWRPQPGVEVTQRITEHVHPGAIVVCHEMLPAVESLTATLSQLREIGYRFVTLSELLHQPVLL